ncbi:unnamed protein product [Lupinus luteus]|uniref:TmcB/TmcC TPR repeats domain-containing protein n=1 Tax=Lupinus luteus TaxID=3873 RepID=A0AAV1WM21_LUPLU
MILVRSSSTPVLGSLLSSFNDTTPSNTIHHSELSHAFNHLPPTCVPQHHFHRKLSVHSSISDLEMHNKGFKRAQSEGNLEDLPFTSFNNNKNKEDISTFMDTPTRFHSRNKYLALETIPSFSISTHKGLHNDEEDEEVGEIEGRFDGSGMVLNEEVRVKDGFCRVSFDDEVGGKQMYLAKGLGIGGCRSGGGGGGGRGGGGGGDYNSMSSGGSDGNRHGVEEYYKKMVKENPGNPLFLRNYAQFLYQCKQDPEGAEEYYCRAILADPKDGEVLSQYGKLVWELHHDKERALSYFERAVQASPEDSHVHAAYASFLWDTEQGKDGSDEHQCLPPQFHLGALATAGG